MYTCLFLTRVLDEYVEEINVRGNVDVRCVNLPTLGLMLLSYMSRSSVNFLYAQHIQGRLPSN